MLLAIKRSNPGGRQLLLSFPVVVLLPIGKRKTSDLRRMETSLRSAVERLAGEKLAAGGGCDSDRLAGAAVVGCEEADLDLCVRLPFPFCRAEQNQGRKTVKGEIKRCYPSCSLVCITSMVSPCFISLNRRGI